MEVIGGRWSGDMLVENGEDELGQGGRKWL